MIETSNIGGGIKHFDIQCDGCSESETTEANSFEEAWAEFKQEGWRYIAIEKGHRCPTCVEQWVTEQRAQQ